MVTIRQMEIFAHSVRAGSFRRSAEKLGISQVVVSEHIRALEGQLGVELFIRPPGGPARLSPTGETALLHVNRILADIGDFIQQVSGKTEKRVVRIHAPAFMMRAFGKRIDSVAQAHPHIEFATEIDQLDTASLLERIANRDLDLAYFYALDPSDTGSSAYLRDEALAIFVGQNHPLAQRGVVAAHELRAVPALHLPVRNPLRSMIDNALDSVGAGNGAIGVETSEFGLMLSMALKNEGFMCMFEAAAEELGQAMGLVQVKIEPPVPPLQIRVATRASAKHDPVLMELMQLLAA